MTISYIGRRVSSYVNVMLPNLYHNAMSLLLVDSSFLQSPPTSLNCNGSILSGQDPAECHKWHVPVQVSPQRFIFLSNEIHHSLPANWAGQKVWGQNLYGITDITQSITGNHLWFTLKMKRKTKIVTENSQKIWSVILRVKFVKSDCMSQSYLLKILSSTGRVLQLHHWLESPTK